jgi:hypothetical protein
MTNAEPNAEHLPSLEGAAPAPTPAPTGEPAPDLSLDALAPDVQLPPDLQPQRRWQRKLWASVGLLALLGLTGAWAYWQWRGQRLALRAQPRRTASASSGQDLKRAAYATLRDALEGVPGTPAPGNLPAPTAGTPAPQATPLAAPDQERVPAVWPPGGAATLAPPPEITAQADSVTQSAQSASPATASPPNPAVAPSATGGAASRSIRFATGARSQPEHSVLPMPGLPPPMTAARPTAPAPQPALGLPAVPAATPHPPGFGAFLPVRLLGVLYTTLPGALARLALVREVSGEGWTLPRGTVLLARVAGSAGARAYLELTGYLVPETGRLTPLAGEVLGNDGGAGLRGQARRVSSLWAKVLDRAAQAGVQLGSSWLSRGGSAVIVAGDPYGSYRDLTGAGQRESGARSFVEVPAGTTGFVLVTALPPPPGPAATPATTAAPATANTPLSDTELAALLTEADPVRLRAALPRLSPALRQVAEAVLGELPARQP